MNNAQNKATMNVFLSSCTANMTQADINKAVAYAERQIGLNAKYVTYDKDAGVMSGYDSDAGEYITTRVSYCRSQNAVVCVVKNSAHGGGYEM